MAKKSKIVKNDKRRQMVAARAQQRRELKRAISDPLTPSDQRLAAVAKLAGLPRDSSPTRLRNRDAVDGRPRGYLGTFGLSRITMRSMALRGELPGITKSSW
jgi:small subunit ribosomal protein S14